MKADFTVFDGDLLKKLQGSKEGFPAVKATYVDGHCMYGCPQNAAVTH